LKNTAVYWTRIKICYETHDRIFDASSIVREEMKTGYFCAQVISIDTKTVSRKMKVFANIKY